MGRLTVTHNVDAVGLDRLRERRADIVAELEAGPDRFTLDEGPFDRYERRLTVSRRSDADGSDGSDGDYEVVERFDYALAVPLWKFLLARPVRRALRVPP
ncbi:MAG: hypothetical protein OEU32_11950, partial [Acidimicrobiia bacterium]|nr:hypothetical protein [Acidimicrobiia bacterium]